MSDTGYPLGTSVWLRGDEYAITGAPFEYAGGMIQEATAGDRTVSVPTPEQLERHSQRSKREWRNQQAGFRRLRETANKSK